MLTIFPWPARAQRLFGKGLAKEEHRLQIDVHDVVPVHFGKVDRVGAADDAGIVHQSVDRARGFPHTVEHRRRRNVIAKVAGNRRERRPFGLHQCCRLVHRGTADADDFAACLGYGHGNALADAGVGAGHDHPLARQAESGKIRHFSVSSGTGSTSV